MWFSFLFLPLPPSPLPHHHHHHQQQKHQHRSRHRVRRRRRSSSRASAFFYPPPPPTFLAGAHLPPHVPLLASFIPPMDRESILQYSGTHFSPSEPVRFHVPPAGSGLSSEDDVSSDSSEDKPPRLHIMAGARTHFPAEEEDDAYGAAFPPTEDPSKNGNYGGHAARSPPVRRAKRPVIRPPIDADVDENVSNSSVANQQSGGDVKYRECLKNHAANIGGHALDGCGEFLPGSTDPLLCSVCGCHRNFHRKEVEGMHSCSCNRNSNVNVNVNSNSKLRGPSGPPTPGLLAITSSKDIIPLPPTDASLSPMPYPDDSDLHSGSSSRKKRYRTKFSAEQKKEMLQFAEKLGWRIVREHEHLVQQFCEDVGVSRNVFKVWMHNNKNNFVKRVSAGEDDISTQRSESPLDY